MEVNWLLSVFLFSSEKLLFDWPTILNSKHGIRDNENNCTTATNNSELSPKNITFQILIKMS